jgi:hypothetical protein
MEQVGGLLPVPLSPSSSIGAHIATHRAFHHSLIPTGIIIPSWFFHIHQLSYTTALAVTVIVQYSSVVIASFAIKHIFTIPVFHQHHLVRVSAPREFQFLAPP